MKVLGKIIVEDFWRRHKTAEKPLKRWLQVTESALWNNFSDVRKTFNNADTFTKDNRKFVIFNVGGNKFRLVAAVNYKGRLVIIQIALTHKSYDKNKWKEVL